MSERILQAEAEGREESNGGQREGDWNEVSVRGGLVAMVTGFEPDFVGGSAGVTGQVSYT